MSEYNPRFISIKTMNEAKSEISKIGSDPKSIDIMAPKAILKVIKMKNIVLQDAIIMKQDMLSVGGEVAIPKDAFDLEKQKADILIMGTIKQLSELVTKLNRHYNRIKQIADELLTLIETLN